MEESHYQTLKSTEDSWWYKGRTFALRAVMERSTVPPMDVLDVGAGHGPMLDFLKQYGPVSAYEIYPDCIESCRGRGYAEVLSSEPELFGHRRSFGLIGAFDVLEHIEDDTRFLAGLRPLLVEGGVFVATVPAHQFLWGPHDITNHHFRRHSKASLRALFEKSGFTVEYLSYWNASLFIPAMAMRLLGKANSDALLPPRPINTMLTKLLSAESRLLRWSALPMGLSLLVVTRPRSS